MLEALQQPDARILIIGYGNPGRCDDGLGPALAHAMAALAIPNLRVESNYQLNIEDADLLAGFDYVIFADASVDCPEPLALTPLEAKQELNFSTHSVSPKTLLAMAGELYNSQVIGYTLALRGYRFNEFDETLSDQATQNLEAAVSFLHSLLAPATNSEIVDVRPPPHGTPQNSTNPLIIQINQPTG